MESLPPRHRGGFKWPEDRKKLQRYVHIDFDKNLDELAKEAESGQFTAVRPKRLTFPEAYDSIEWLGKFIQDHRVTAAPVQRMTDEPKTEDGTMKPEEKRATLSVNRKVVTLERMIDRLKEYAQVLDIIERTQLGDLSCEWF